MLELVVDNRSGTKLELVVPVLNEEKRIGNIFRYYGTDFDIVLMDGGSTDATIDLAIRSGGTVFRRRGPDYVGENHFVHYANHVTKSGYSFYLFADEFVEREDIFDAWIKLQKRRCVILGRRIDWLYGRRINRPSSTTPRGMRRGDAIYNPEKLHASLEYSKGLEEIQIDIHHCQIWSMKHYFGQAGSYAYTEVEQFLKSDKPIWRFIRRFFISEVLMLPRRLWYQRNDGLASLSWMVLVSLTIPLIGLLCLIEQRFLLSPEEQLEGYAKFYAGN